MHLVLRHRNLYPYTNAGIDLLGKANPLKHGLILTYMAKSEVVETSSFGSKPNVITVILTLHIFTWLLPLSMLLITPQILVAYSKHLGFTGHLRFI